MDLTIHELKQLRKTLKETTDVVSDILKTHYPDNGERRLFNSRFDYAESVETRSLHPQDFYYLRFFDRFVQLTFHQSQKKYSLYVTGFYTDMLNKYKRNPRSDNSYYLDGMDFESSLRVFYDICSECMRQIVCPQAELFVNGMF